MVGTSKLRGLGIAGVVAAWVCAVAPGAEIGPVGSVPPDAFDRPSAGDNPGEEQPPPRGFAIPPAPALTPAEALASFRLPPGYRMEVVASEPLVDSPVAIDFDPDGRMWVVEMRGYQNDFEGRTRLEPNGRIVVLEDTDGDGRMDRRTVYLDGLVLPRAVKVLSDGVLVAEPPHLWLTRDTDGDFQADTRVAVTDDYGVRDGNPGRTPAGLHWTMDNWIQSTLHPKHFRRGRDGWVSRAVPVLGDWGFGMDDFGRTYLNGSSGPLRANLVAAEYQLRNPHVASVGGVYEVITGPEEQNLWPARVNPGVNRGYMPGVLRPDGTLAKYTAAAGITIYRGDRLPAELRGNHFFAEPAGNLIRRSVLTEHADGRLTARNPHHRTEFIASTDERFRPVNVNTAPDGTLYVVDMYRGFFEAHPFVTTYLKRQVLERGLLMPQHLGRIYRVVHESMSPGPAPRLSQRSGAELVGVLSHRNGWWRDTAQRLLVEKGDVSVAPVLRREASSAEWEVTRLHALWTLEGLGVLGPEDLVRAAGDRSEKVRAASVRLAEPWLRRDDEARVVGAVTAAANDGAAAVRLQAAFSLGERPGGRGDAALTELLTRHAGQPYLISAVVSGLAGRELEFLQRLAATPAGRVASPALEEAVSSLAAAVFTEGAAQRVARLLEWTAAAERIGWQQRAVLGSISRPVRLSARVAMPGFEHAPDPQLVSLAAKLDRLLTGPRSRGIDGALGPAEQAQFKSGERSYIVYCAPCHQADGKGVADVATPLVGSKWVLGHEELLARIVLAGKQGKATLMPPWGNVLEDAQIAAVLTYVRNAWGNQSPPVLPSTVRKVRHEIRALTGFWTDEALEKEVARLQR